MFFFVIVTQYVLWGRDFVLYRVYTKEWCGFKG